MKTQQISLWDLSLLLHAFDFAEFAYTMKITEKPDVYSFGVNRVNIACLHNEDHREMRRVRSWSVSVGSDQRDASKIFSFLVFIFISQHEHSST
ncbi:hypothetical protein CUMW_250230 [Citrus unshiu]|uniref:Uncharacterized protein n=1 Tax=Citrus unshiu TaxID=55188 RepID=A0A2H5QPT2_CITUN|nr:hypothetical protein CUMW_250230 [Citrus unshiu]